MERAKTALDAARQTEERARPLNVLGVVTSEPDEALGYVESALAAASTSQDKIATLNNKAYLLGRKGDHEAAIPLLSDAITTSARAGYRHQQAALLDHLADIYHRVGRRVDAEETQTRAVTIFADIDAGAWEPEIWLLRRW